MIWMHHNSLWNRFGAKFTSRWRSRLVFNRMKKSLEASGVCLFLKHAALSRFTAELRIIVMQSNDRFTTHRLRKRRGFYQVLPLRHAHLLNDGPEPALELQQLLCVLPWTSPKKKNTQTAHSSDTQQLDLFQKSLYNIKNTAGYMLRSQWRLTKTLNYTLLE